MVSSGNAHATDTTCQSVDVEGAHTLRSLAGCRDQAKSDCGTRDAWGASYFAFCQAAAEHGEGTRCFGVDTWAGDDHAGKYDDTVYRNVVEFNERYAGSSQLLRSTFDNALKQFDDGTIDLLHIDGLHTYEAVRHDFETWFPKMSPSGVVLFHDTNERGRDFGVWQLWDELKPNIRPSSFRIPLGSV